MTLEEHLAVPYVLRMESIARPDGSLGRRKTDRTMTGRWDMYSASSARNGTDWTRASPSIIFSTWAW